MFVVWLLLSIFVFSCAPADSNIIRRCRFHVGSLWFVVTVPMMLFGHHRRHKLACCTCVAFDVVVVVVGVVVVVVSFCFVHFAQRSVCPLRGLLRCLMYAFVLLFPSNRFTLCRRNSVT